MKKIHLIITTIITLSLLFSCNRPVEESSGSISESTSQSEVSSEQSSDNTSKEDTNLYPDYEEIPFGLDITLKENVVSIMYETWFNDVIKPGTPIYDKSVMYRENPENPQYGPLYSKHYWAEPALGYYRSDDVDVMKTHMKQIYELGVDFLVIDATNVRFAWPMDYQNLLTWEPVQLLLDTMLEMRENGENTPYLMFYAGSWTSGYKDDPSGVNEDEVTKPEYVAMEIYKRYYESGKYKDLFVYYEGKPLINLTEALPDLVREYFTIRKMWGMQMMLAAREWSGLQFYPQKVGMNGKMAEHVSVSAAVQETYMNLPTAVPRNGGRTLAKQWSRAFDIKPKVVFISEWNSWVAIKFQDEEGNALFNDSYDIARSRDIEPMKYGFGDLYYQWTKQYIAAYKADEPMPEGLHIEEEEHVMTWEP